MGKHERILEAMRKKPRPSNLRWTDIESLFLHFGAVIVERKGSAISITLKGVRGYFHRPHPGDKADKGAVDSALRLLWEAGVIDGSEERDAEL